MGSGVLPLAMATRLFCPEGRCRKSEIRTAAALSGSADLPIPEEASYACVFGEASAASVLISDFCHLPSEPGSCRWMRALKRHRAISTGQLRRLPCFHLRPIDVVVYHGSRRDLVLRRVSRLDAFSGYPVRT